MAGQATTEEDAAARERLAEIRKQIDNLIEAVAEGTSFASLREQLIELGRQEQELKMEAVTLESALNRQASEITIRDDYRWFPNTRDLVGAGSPDERKMVMRALVRKVEGGKEMARITFKVLPAPFETNHDRHGLIFITTWLTLVVIARAFSRDLRLCKQPRFW